MNHFENKLNRIFKGSTVALVGHEVAVNENLQQMMKTPRIKELFAPFLFLAYFFLLFGQDNQYVEK